MRHGYERSVIRGNPENDVCRGEVGEQLPVARETVEPFDIIVGQAALGMDEITEGGHPTSLMARVELLRAPRTMWHAIGGRGPQVGSPRLLYARALQRSRRPQQRRRRAESLESREPRTRV